MYYYREVSRGSVLIGRQTRNALMFPPDADVSPYNISIAQAIKDAKLTPKTIKHGNTRLPEQDDKLDHSVSAPPSPTRSRIDAAIAGTPCMHPLIVLVCSAAS